ncbi:RNA polymerase sigma factor [Tunicatimonas pelagia]|uniref:RNA polymerase sigma factor n=1 Tax=Tunicatimonas pelagia TaxID=931531 RepID=UPI0026665B6D|nr:sigma-70 family RNA polymerase sigma factor [Tunicatimonas pelagia]WKN42748.1 sigma-70 family RNA polymerase sigma factor [Tunicatimonas pelagia]
MRSETDIIQAIASGKERALAMLYERYSEKVYNTALSYTKNAEDAEEITQDVFVKIFRKAATFEGKSSLTTWIYRIVVNTSLTYVKKRNRFSFFTSPPKPSESIDFVHPGVLLENKENAFALYKAMDCLPDSQKTAFILSFIEELPRQKVADIMKVSLKAVESLLQRAKKNMRSELEKVYPHRRNPKN